MTIIIENIGNKALNRLSKNKVGDKVSFAGIREKGIIDVGFEDDNYKIESGRMFDDREYIIISHKKARFAIFTGDFDRVIVA